jgi:hypothetical protein
MTAPCEDVNKLLRIGPVVDNSTKLKIKGKPIVTVNITIRTQINADKNSIVF